MRQLKSLHLELTQRCNHKCFYCYNSKDEDSVSYDELSTRVQFATEHSEEIVFTGGEPFINYPVLKKAISIAKSYNCKKISINTNGSLLNEDLISELYQIDKNMMFLVSLPTIVSKNYIEITKTNDLEKVLNNLENLLYKFGSNKVVVNYVINDINKHDINPTADWLHSKGVRNFKYSFVSCTDNFSFPLIKSSEIIKIFKEIYDIKKKYPWLIFASSHAFPVCATPNFMIDSGVTLCSLGQGGASINNNGKLTPCPQLNSDTFQFKLDHGNLKFVFDNQFENIVTKSPCSACLLVEYCNGGCKAENFNSAKLEFRPPHYSIGISENEMKVKMLLLGIFPQKKLISSVSFVKINQTEYGIEFLGKLLDVELIKVNNSVVSWFNRADQDSEELKDFIYSVVDLFKNQCIKSSYNELQG